MSKPTAYNRDYYVKHKHVVLQRQRDYREKHKDQFKAWYQQNKAKVLQRVRKYHQHNKAKRAAYERERRRRIKVIAALLTKSSPGGVPMQMTLAYILN
ncbi:hypothetical protein AeMF1_003590 [Aphanomyces euteiches]|nr:hypothetical protein AeMF1_003590 [Aphanomyces euteiches]KAH9187294.1 hypothetical protein AeNC1_010730 [Aphanomyces euteiches]